MEQMTLMDKGRMKRSNRRLIFKEVYDRPAISRPELARRTGMSAMSAGRIADELCALGLLESACAPDEHTQGRPPRLLRVAAEKLLCVGLQVDQGGLSTGVCDPYGNIAYMSTQEGDLRQMLPEDAADALARAYTEARRAHPEAAQCLGVSVPGLTDDNTGTVLFSSQLNWRDVPLAAMLEERLPGVPVQIDNDIKAWALAEKQFGTTKEYMDSVLLSIGSGLGAAAVVNGALHRGRNNMAGEIGHIAVDTDGRMCQCGRIGCLQTGLADWAVLQEARAVRPDAKLADVFMAYERGEQWALSLVSRMVNCAEMAISLLVNTYAPEAVVLCGNTVDKFPMLVERIQERRRRAPGAFSDNSYTLLVSHFGERGAVVGAAALAFQRLLDNMII